MFSGANASLGPQNITMRVYPTNNGTLSFEGSAGQLFSVTNSLTGTLFSVNDVSGVPSIEVTDTGLIRLGQYGGSVAFGNNATVTAAGSTQGTATLLTRQINNVTAGSGGVLLPTPVGGERIVIRNALGSSITVYPQVGGQIKSSGVNIGVSHGAGATLEYVAMTSSLWFLLNSVYA